MFSRICKVVTLFIKLNLIGYLNNTALSKSDKSLTFNPLDVFIET